MNLLDHWYSDFSVHQGQRRAGIIRLPSPLLDVTSSKKFKDYLSCLLCLKISLNCSGLTLIIKLVWAEAYEIAFVTIPQVILNFLFKRHTSKTNV